MNPLRVAEQALLFRDGWIAIARLDPYGVEWRSPDGRPMRAAPIVVPQVRMDESIKRAAIIESLGVASSDVSTSSFRDWPDEVPPFTRSALVAAPDGALLVERQHIPGADGAHYDVVDRRGVRTASLELAPTEHLVGSGAHVVYVVRTNDDGIERLRRVPWLVRVP